MNFRERLKKREVLLGTMVRDALILNVVDALKWAGVDFFVLDMEHTSVDVSSAGPLLQYARARDLPAIVRVPTLDKAFIGRVLDCGAVGVWLPHLDNPEEARQFYSLARYPPAGKRGGTIPWFRRAQSQSFTNLREFFAVVDKEVILVGQIESQDAVNNIASILDTGLLDAVVIGPLDLSLDLGFPGESSHPTVEAAITRVLAEASKQGVSVGLHTGNLAELAQWHERGMNFLVYSYDLVLMTERLKEARTKLFQGKS
ncbi:MAG: hypothetical protein H5U03_01025 [Clostridia bacterium]|nr:hypothetical protein [Clostridia bacterium]